MTINERAVKLCKEILYGDPDPRTVSSIAAAMTEAVVEERRINARIARDYDQRWNPATCDAIAAAIMSRDVFTEHPLAAKAPDPSFCKHSNPGDAYCKPCENEMIDRAERIAEGGEP